MTEKVPEDRLPKKTSKKPIDQVKTVTLDGHDYQIDPAVFDDIRALEYQEDGKYVSLLRLMLGPAQWEQFYDNHANEQGRVTGAKMQTIMADLQGSDLQGELGNS